MVRFGRENGAWRSARAWVSGRTNALLCAGALALGGLAAGAAGPARAGTYEVYACHTSFGGVAPAFQAFADPGLTAYSECPTGGLVVRSSWDGGTSRYLQGAYQFVDAPPDAVIQSLHGYIKLERNDCSWAANVVASDRDLAGRLLFALNGWSPGCSVYGADWSFQNLAVNAPRVRIEARCAQATCPRTGPAQAGLPPVAAVRMRDIRLVIRDDTTPQILNPRGSLWSSDGWLRGTQQVAFDATDNTGIRGATVTVDGGPSWSSAKACNWLIVIPCPSSGMDLPIDTRQMGSDGAHRLILQAQDAAGNPATATRTIRIDNTPPQPLRAAVLRGQQGWRSANDFTIDFDGLIQDAGSPNETLEYELCPVTSGTQSCISGSNADAPLAQLSHVHLPADGEWRMRAWVRDAAGNRAAPGDPLTTLLLDKEPPEVALLPTDPGTPTLMTARVSDGASGVQEGELAIRREGTATWRVLPTTATDGLLLARLDDDRLSDGRYDVRAFAVDRAGNERTTTSLPDGSTARMQLPVRVRTSLRAGVSLSRAQSTLVFRYGALGAVKGRLTGPDGSPIAGAQVIVYSRALVPSASDVAVGSVTTSSRGTFAYRPSNGPSRILTFKYAGSELVRSSAFPLRLDVRARSTVAVDKRQLLNGERIRFSGRVLGPDVPKGGKLVELQVLLRGRFRTFATTRSRSSGVWRHFYRFDGTRGLKTYRFRARVPSEVGYPYSSGTSRSVVVTVRGL